MDAECVRLGGAERLIVDAALALQTSGHTVDIYTSHHDPRRCFVETKDGTLNVIVVGNRIPRHILGKGHILFSTLRNLAAARFIVANYGRTLGRNDKRRVRNGEYDVIVVDQLSTSIPLLAATPARILFYGHFPDLLLTQRRSWIKRLYRMPFDWLEGFTTSCSDKIVVNSKFTKNQFFKTFPVLEQLNANLEVLYPSINFDKYDTNTDYRELRAKAIMDSWSWFSKSWSPADATKAIVSALKDKREDTDDIPVSTAVFVSINRYERKKNIGLAISAYAILCKNLEASREKDAQYGYTSAKLIVAGGYDPKLAENVSYYKELIDHATSLGLKVSYFPIIRGDVIFMRDFTEAQRSALLRRAQAVIYTPENEHFGIVPIEAMYSGVPVIACASGGPLETVKPDGETGYLCEPTPLAFSEAMLSIMNMSKLGEARGASAYLEPWIQRERQLAERARHRVVSLFDTELFRLQLDTHVKNTYTLVDFDQPSGHSARITKLRSVMKRLGSTPQARLTKITGATLVAVVLFVVIMWKTVRALQSLRG